MTTDARSFPHGPVTAARLERRDVTRLIRRVLGRLDRRLRALAAVKTLGTTLLVATLGAAAGMAADLLWRLPNGARWGIWVAWVGATLAPLAVAAARGGIKKSKSLDLAAVMERLYPALGERLTGAVGLLVIDGDGDGVPAHGSPALIEALARDAAVHVGVLDALPPRPLPTRGAWHRLALGLAAAAIFGAPAVVIHDPFGRLAARFAMPWAGFERVGWYDVKVEPGDVVKAIGDDLNVKAWVAPRIGRSQVRGGAGAWLEWTEDATGLGRRLALSEGKDESHGRAFSVVLPGLTGSIAYRVVTASGESRRYRVRALPPPALARVSARVEPPCYTKMPAFEARDPARVEAWEGSQIGLTLTTAGPVRSAEVAWPASVKPKRVAAEVAADGRSATASVTADASGEYAITLHDAQGLINRPEPPRRVVVRPDEPPSVAVVGADGLDEASAEDTLRVGLDAKDDVAVASAELHYSIERASGSESAFGDDPKGDTGQVAASLPGLGTRSARGEAALGLKPLNVKPGDVVVYRARVTDNRPAPRGPNVGWSAPRRLTVVAKAEPFWTRRDKAGREAIRSKLESIKKAAAVNRHETEQLRYAADAVQRGNGEWDRDQTESLARREAETRAVAESLDALALELADEPAFRPLARPTRQAAEVEAEAARAALDRARQADDAAKRLAALRQADAHQGAVAARIEELQREFNALAEREADRRRLQALADRQAQVADQADHDRAQLDKLAAEQNAVKNDLDSLLKKAPELRAGVLADQAVEAEALARRARELAQHQRDEARRATSLAGKAAMLKALADEQRALEDDARRLALEVDTPLTEDGRPRLNTEAIRQAADPIERGELEQGRQRLATAEVDLNRLTRDLEDAPADPRGLALRLSQRENQIADDLNRALGDARDKNALPNGDHAEVTKALDALAVRQKAVAVFARAILATKEANADPNGDAKAARPRFPRDSAEKAAAAADRAAEAIASPAHNPRETSARVSEARAALDRLARELPGPWNRVEPVLRAVSEARREINEAVHDAERHLRETEADFQRDPARGAAELARRLAPIAAKARQAADRLAGIEPEPRLEPQRDRAARRARGLAEAVELARGDNGSERDRARALRDALAASATAAYASLERFELKLQSHIPADDLADDLAEEQRVLAPGAPDAAADQQRIAIALRSLRVPDAPLEHAEAVRLSARAARLLGPGENRATGVEAIRHSAEAARALADRLTDRQNGRVRPPARLDPDHPVGPAQADRARALARRERTLRERLQGMLGGQVEPQEALRSEAAAVGRDLAELRDRAAPLSDRSRGPASEAASLLGQQAPRVMDEAAAQLAQGQPAAARAAQRNAAEVAERGAQRAEDFAEALRADSAAGAESKHRAGPGALSSARAALDQSARRLGQARGSSPDPAAFASARLAARAAADRLQAAAEAQQGQGQGPPDGEGRASSSPSTGDPRGAPAGVADPDTLAGLQDQIRTRTGRRWGELPGHLRSELLQMSQGRYRDDYARLIELYFREIAAGAGAGRGAKP